MKQADVINLFIISDDQLLVDALKDEIQNAFAFYHISVTMFNTAEDCGLFIKNKLKPDIMIVDEQLNKSIMGSISLIDMAKAANSRTEAIMLTRAENADMAVKALEHSVHDYVVKNEFLFKKIKITLLQCIKVTQLRQNMKKQVSLGILSIIIIFLMFGVVFGLHFYEPGSPGHTDNEARSNTENMTLLVNVDFTK